MIPSPHNTKGFSLMELIAVMVIMVAMIGFFVRAYNSFVDKAKLTSSISALKTLKMEIDTYSHAKGKFPDTINFDSFTDQDGAPIIDPTLVAELKLRINTWESYSSTKDSYILQARAKNSANALLTLTPKDVTY